MVWKTFTLSMKLPCYEKLKKYNFHDVLIALVKNCFAIQHRRETALRLQRTKEALESGLPLTKWEAMKEDSDAFQGLDITEQERFLDMTCGNFWTVVDRIEEKGLRTGKEEIFKLKMMKERRRKVDLPYKESLDKFYDDGKMVIIDSSKLFGAQVIVKFIRRWKKVKSGLAEAPSPATIGFRSSKLGSFAKSLMLMSDNMDTVVVRARRASFYQIMPNEEKIVEISETKESQSSSNSNTEIG